MNITGRPINPKPDKPIRGKAGREYMAKVAELPCVICGLSPVQVHHVICGRFSQRKASDMDTIPLCHSCHAELHAGKDTWAERHGPDTDYLAQVRRAVEDKALARWF